MDIINILTFQKYRDSDSLKSIAPLELLGGQNQMMSFVIKNRIADEVVKLEDKVSKLEKELETEKSKPSIAPIAYNGPLQLTSKMISRLTEDEIGILSGQIGAPFDKNKPKSVNAQCLSDAITSS